ncbi:unnamed protein product [Trypanosoma congolense IL3000]|uniref:WGS project CAEQ00000000 data, annotated contig 296 n=1 Tax=Trypanosoma congolense (strain IL3000) TaxID=1068625 RepID=F9WEP2_TRYCI|nr:unnamed protein product [Trypanosoma congolense IL3000]
MRTPWGWVWLLPKGLSSLGESYALLRLGKGFCMASARGLGMVLGLWLWLWFGFLCPQWVNVMSPGRLAPLQPAHPTGTSRTTIKKTDGCRASELLSRHPGLLPRSSRRGLWRRFRFLYHGGMSFSCDRRCSESVFLGFPLRTSSRASDLDDAKPSDVFPTILWSAGTR